MLVVVLYNTAQDTRPGSYSHHTNLVLFIGLNSPFSSREEKNDTIVMSYTRIKRMRIYMWTKKRDLWHDAACMKMQGVHNVRDGLKDDRETIDNLIV